MKKVKHYIFNKRNRGKVIEHYPRMFRESIALKYHAKLINNQLKLFVNSKIGINQDLMEIDQQLIRHRVKLIKA